MKHKTLILFSMLICGQAHAARVTVKTIEQTMTVDHHQHYSMEIEKHDPADGKLLSMIASVETSAKTLLVFENSLFTSPGIGSLGYKRESRRNYVSEIRLNEHDENSWLVGYATGYNLATNPLALHEGADGVFDYRGPSGTKSIRVIGQRPQDRNVDLIENDPAVLQQFQKTAGESHSKTLYVFNPTLHNNLLFCNLGQCGNFHQITTKLTIQYVIASATGTNQAPPAPTDLSASQDLAGRVLLQWGATPAARDILIYLNDSCDSNGLNDIIRVDQSDSYMDEAGSGFGKFYTLRARGHNGKLSDCSLPVFGVAAPVDSQVYELARTSHINLSYDAVNQLVDIDWDPVPGAESYQVLKLVSAPAHPAPEGPYLLMENETSVSSIDLSPQWGKMNCYRIVPENRISKLSFSDLWSNESWEHACIIVP